MKNKPAIVNLKLEITDESGDCKRLFFKEITGDNFEECRMEADTDDADSKHVKDCVNACAGIEDLSGIEALKQATPK